MRVCVDGVASDEFGRHRKRDGVGGAASQPEASEEPLVRRDLLSEHLRLGAALFALRLRASTRLFYRSPPIADRVKPRHFTSVEPNVEREKVCE